MFKELFGFSVHINVKKNFRSEGVRSNWKMEIKKEIFSFWFLDNEWFGFRVLDNKRFDFWFL